VPASGVYEESIRGSLTVADGAIGSVQIPIPEPYMNESSKWIVPVLDKITIQKTLFFDGDGETFKISLSTDDESAALKNIDDDEVFMLLKEIYDLSAGGFTFKDKGCIVKNFDWPRPMVFSEELWLNLDNDMGDSLTIYYKLDYHLDSVNTIDMMKNFAKWV
jgi:hypothetical protein